MAHQSRRGKGRSLPPKKKNFLRNPTGGDNRSASVEAEIGFKSTDDPVRKIELAQSITSRRSGNRPLIIGRAGSMLLELSLDTRIPEAERLELFGSSFEHLSKAVKLDTSPGRIDTLEARNHLSHLAVYQALVLGQKPQTKQLESSYGEMMSFSYDLAKSNWEFGSNKKFGSPRQVIGGMQAEICINALLSRYESKHLQDASWIALPSMFSENHSRSAAGLKNSWDVSGFVVMEEPDYTLMYKIQSKNGRSNMDNKTLDTGYRPDIIVINPGKDLAKPCKEVTPNNGIAPEYMLDDLRADYDGTANQVITERIEYRTNTLLDILG